MSHYDVSHYDVSHNLKLLKTQLDALKQLAIADLAADHPFKRVDYGEMYLEN